jgi:hypothetical protein
MEHDDSKRNSVARLLLVILGMDVKCLPEYHAFSVCKLMSHGPTSA